jgi:IS605 OrfB family transposase
MEILRSVKLKLKLDPSIILPTIENYTKSFNYVCDIGWKDNDLNSISLHQKTYKTVREYLPSQLSCSSRIKAAEALKPCLDKRRKSKKVTKPQSKQSSIRYDACSFNIWFNRNECSISTINGRIKCKFEVADCFKQYLEWKRCSAELFIRKDKVFLNIIFKKETDNIEISNNSYIIGIDRGINQIAVCSNNKFYKNNTKEIIRRNRRIRSKLQACGSRSAKRHLKRLSLKENRFRKDMNHCISKQIIQNIPENSIIVLEDLKNIRSKIKTNKIGRRELNNWTFYQLEQFLTYKAQSKNIILDHQDARYTSQKCSCCGHIDRKNRKYTSLFKCVKCGFTLNADLNASRNIELNYRNSKGYPEGLSANQPIVSTIETN